MTRRYTYETTLDLSGVERDVSVTFECPDHELEIIDVQVDETPTLTKETIQTINDLLLREHAERMLQEAIEADADASVEEQERRDEWRAERAGWRV